VAVVVVFIVVLSPLGIAARGCCHWRARANTLSFSGIVLLFSEAVVVVVIHSETVAK
jgi:hypothetical protein